MATRSNKKVALDLKEWKDSLILHLVDVWSRLMVSVFIERKKPGEVIEIMTHWIGTGFGVMEAILTDNWGELSSDETKEVASSLNIEVCTTAAVQSLFQNGLYKRIHPVTDAILMKLEEEYSETSSDVFLCWANTVRNSLLMWHRYS